MNTMKYQRFMKIMYSILLLLPSFLFAQQRIYETIDTDTSRTEISKINNQSDKYPAVILKDHKIIEYLFDGQTLNKYDTEYRKVLINSETGIDYFNRVYIYSENVTDIVKLEVQTTTASGKVIKFNKENIKEVENLENKGSYKIFAVEGIETGSIVEILYTLKRKFTEYGKYSFHDKFPTYNATYELHTPEHLIFNIKAYNADFERTDTVYNKMRHIIYSADTLNSSREEKYSTWEANIPKVIFQYSHNSATTTLAVNLWSDAVKSMQPFFYKASKADKKVKKIIKSLELSDLSEEEKIKKIENYIKNNYEIKPIRGIEDITSLRFILDKKYTNKDGITLLFAKMLTAANIEHMIGFTSNRFESKFDPDFFTWQSLYEYVIYFPKSDTYLAPSSQEYRLGIIPVEICNNYALFINNVTIGDYTTVLPEKKYIPNTPMEKNFTNQLAKISFNEDKTTALVDYRHELGGYESNYIKPYYDFIPAENKDEILKEMLQLMGEDTKIIEKSVKNTNHNISGLDETFILEGKLEVQSLIENAGDNFIFNVGNVIGEQVEMYDDHERDNSIELRHVHYYKRDIAVQIPEGYNAKGLESIKINKEYGNGKEMTMGFISDYAIEGNILNITVYEYYKSITYPLEQYDEFRTVINAAADFNKISIVFEKK